MSKLRTFPVFALCGLFLMLAASGVLLSTKVYRSVETASVSHGNHRIILSYLMSQLRSNDGAGRIEIGSYGDSDAFIFFDGEYKTILYCYNGSLMELFTNQSVTLPPETGTIIAAAKQLSIVETDGLLQLTMITGAGDVVYGEYHRLSAKEVRAT